MENIKLPSFKLSKSIIAEAYRTLRTNIQFSSFDSRVKTIVITSSGPSEGKTTVSCNLAISIAQTGKRTVLLDCDMRKPKIHRVFGISNLLGFSDILIGETNFCEVANKTEIDNLFIIPSGTTPLNPAELLSSVRMKKFLDAICEAYDCIIIDTPPIVMFTDAQILAQRVDGSLLVIASGQTEKSSILKAKELLDKVEAKIIGVVINKYEISKKEYNLQYYYEENREKNRKKRKKEINSNNQERN